MNYVFSLLERRWISQFFTNLNTNFVFLPFIPARFAFSWETDQNISECHRLCLHFNRCCLYSVILCENNVTRASFSFPGPFSWLGGGAGKGPVIGWSRVYLTPCNPGCARLLRLVTFIHLPFFITPRISGCKIDTWPPNALFPPNPSIGNLLRWSFFTFKSDIKWA